MFFRKTFRPVFHASRQPQKASDPCWRVISFEALEVRRVFAANGIGSTLMAEGEGGPVQDFALVDVNTTSSSYQQSVSPRDYLEQVSAWYFGHAS